MSETGMDEEREVNDPKTVIPKQAVKQIFFRPNLRMAMIIKNVKNDNSLKQGKYMEWQRLWSIKNCGRYKLDGTMIVTIILI